MAEGDCFHPPILAEGAFSHKVGMNLFTPDTDNRGSQYTSHAYRRLLTRHKAVASMSRPGNAYDNAPMESFFATLKSELVHHRHFQTRDQAKQAIFEYIEVFYNRRRLHSALDYRSPVEFEALFRPS